MGSGISKREFERVNKAMNNKKINFKDAQKNQSDLFCYKCKEIGEQTQAGLKFVYKTKYTGGYRIVCTKHEHKETLINYLIKEIENYEEKILKRLFSCNAFYQKDFCINSSKKQPPQN